MAIRKDINIIPDDSWQRIHVSQGDIGRTLQFVLYEGSTSYTIPTGATVKIQGTKPSGLGFSETCTWSGSTVTIDTTEAMTQEFGGIPTELQITDGDDVLGTSNFMLVVERNPHPDNTTDGTQDTIASLEVRIEALESAISSGGITDDIKQALLDCFEHVAWTDANGQDYYDALEDALYPPADLVSISCVYTQSGTVYDTDTLDSLKSDLVVTAHYDNSTTQTVTSYTLSGTLTEGTSTITVTYGGKTTTFTVTVTHYVDTSLYNWDFTNSLIDSKSGATATLGNDLTRDSNGLDYTARSQYVDLGEVYALNRTIEIDVTDFDIQESTDYNTRFVMIGDNNLTGNTLLTWRHNVTVGWSSYIGAWSSVIFGNLTDRNAFANSTIKLQISTQGTLTLYVNGTLIGSSTLTCPSASQHIYIGSGSTDRGMGADLHNTKITGVRIYEGVV